MTAPPLRVVPLGDQALTLVFGDRLAADTRARVRGALEQLRRAPPEGVTELVPAYTTLSVWFDPDRRQFEELAAELGQALASGRGEATPATGREWVIPVRYGGPDLDHVAARTRLPREEVIARHTGRGYQVLLLGFVPGFAYLGELDPALVLPRRASPRLRVPSGSVAIAGEQTAVYPLETPGGWHLIGHTDLRLFDPARDPPALLGVGDRVRFEAVS